MSDNGSYRSSGRPTAALPTTRWGRSDRGTGLARATRARAPRVGADHATLSIARASTTTARPLPCRLCPGATSTHTRHARAPARGRGDKRGGGSRPWGRLQCGAFFQNRSCTLNMGGVRVWWEKWVCSNEPTIYSMLYLTSFLLLMHHSSDPP